MTSFFNEVDREEGNEGDLPLGEGNSEEKDTIDTDQE